MSIARISENGQITVPIEVRRLLGLKTGDKVFFSKNKEGEIVIGNASSYAILKAQKAFSGVAEKLGIEDDDDVQAIVDETRRGER